MALTLKEVIRTNIYGREVWVTDKTGAYNASTNVGGWGAPNKELADSALLCIVKRQSGSDNAVVEKYLEALEGVPQITHNPGAINTDVNSFGFTYDTDGHYIASLFRLRVSTDSGATDLEGIVIADGDYFVMSNLLYVKESGSPVLVPVEDYPDLLEEDSITQVTCEVMFYNKLLIKDRDYYKEYKDKRDTSCEDAKEWLHKYFDLRADIAGADYSFRSGLKIEAEDIIDSLLEQHAIQ